MYDASGLTDNQGKEKGGGFVVGVDNSDNMHPAVLGSKFYLKTSTAVTEVTVGQEPSEKYQTIYVPANWRYYTYRVKVDGDYVEQYVNGKLILKEIREGLSMLEPFNLGLLTEDMNVYFKNFKLYSNE